MAGELTSLALSRGIGLVGATPPPPPDPFAAAVYDLNFFSNTYKGGLLTEMVREAGNYVGGFYEIEATGALVSTAANVIQRTANGLEVWPQRRNVVLWNRDLTNAAWVKTNLTAVKDQIGRDGVVNAASRITATADGGTVLQVITLASSARAQSVDIKRISGAGTLEMTMDGGVTWVALAGITGSYTRLSIPTQTLANPQVGFRIGTGGDSFAIDYVQNEDSNTVGPRIATTTASTLRPQNRATCQDLPPLRDIVKGDVFGFYWEGRMDVAGGGGAFVSDVAGGFQVRTSNTGVLALGTAGTGPTTPTDGYKFGQIQKIAGVMTAPGAGGCKMCLNGGSILTGSINSNSTITHFDVGTNGAGANNIRGIVKRIAFFNSLTDAELVSLTA